MEADLAARRLRLGRGIEQTHEAPEHVHDRRLVAVQSGSELGLQFAQLDLQGRLDPAQPSYDPVAERVLINLLGSGRR